MINLMDVSYVRLGTPDMESAETFATSCLGLQVAERAKKALYLRSDDRSHTQVLLRTVAFATRPRSRNWVIAPIIIGRARRPTSHCTRRSRSTDLLAAATLPFFRAM